MSKDNREQISELLGALDQGFYFVAAKVIPAIIAVILAGAVVAFHVLAWVWVFARG